MAFNVFKKKEVIKDNPESKNDKDIVQDFGELIKNNSFDLETSEQEIQFNNNLQSEENITNTIEKQNMELYIFNTINKIQDVSNMFEISYDESVKTSNKELKTSEPINNSIEIKSSFNDLKDEKNIPVKEEVVPENNIPEYDNVNINNLNYNPIIDSLENVQKNIYNSEDVNIALSNIYGTTVHKEEKEENEQSILNQVNNTPIIMSEDDDIDIEPGFRRCKKCNQKIREDYKECFVCGTKF